MLAVIRPDFGDADQPDHASAMRHLEQCADCQALIESRRSIDEEPADRELSRAMRNVMVPADLKSRLLAQLAATNPVTVASTASAAQPAATGEPVRSPAPGRLRTRRRIAAVVSAALLLIAFCGGWWFIHVNQKPQLWVDNLLALSHAPLPTGAFQGTFRPKLPVSEILLPAQRESTTALSLQSGNREIGAVFPYSVRLSARNPLSVVLVVIDLKRVLVPDLNSVGNSFQAAVPYYPKPSHYATKVWRVGENLYVCYVKSSDSNALPRLKTHSLAT